MHSTRSRSLPWAAVAWVLASATLSGAQSTDKPAALGGASGQALKVCADPNNLPQSDERGAGYENKLAELLARDLRKRLEYTFFPQRIGFVRNTLKSRAETGDFRCDLIMGVPQGYGPTATTQPYMRSTYALVVPARAKLGPLTEASDLLKLPKERLAALRFGIFAQTPGTDWLLKNDLLDHATSYAAQSGDPNEHPANVVERDLEKNVIDVAIVWGPVAGFLANRHRGPQGWTAVPFKPDPEIRFDYEIGMGVRFGDKAWQGTVDRWIHQHHAEIDALLASYGVPLLERAKPERGPPATPGNDH